MKKILGIITLLFSANVFAKYNPPAAPMPMPNFSPMAMQPAYTPGTDFDMADDFENDDASYDADWQHAMANPLAPIDSMMSSEEGKKQLAEQFKQVAHITGRTDPTEIDAFVQEAMQKAYETSSAGLNDPSISPEERNRRQGMRDEILNTAKQLQNSGMMEELQKNFEKEFEAAMDEEEQAEYPEPEQNKQAPEIIQNTALGKKASEPEAFIKPAVYESWREALLRGETTSKLPQSLKEHFRQFFKALDHKASLITSQLGFSSSPFLQEMRPPFQQSYGQAATTIAKIAGRKFYIRVIFDKEYAPLRQELVGLYDKVANLSVLMQEVPPTDLETISDQLDNATKTNKKRQTTVFWTWQSKVSQINSEMTKVAEKIKTFLQSKKIKDAEASKKKIFAASKTVLQNFNPKAWQAFQDKIRPDHYEDYPYSSKKSHPSNPLHDQSAKSENPKATNKPDDAKSSTTGPGKGAPMPGNQNPAALQAELADFLKSIEPLLNLPIDKYNPDSCLKLTEAFLTTSIDYLQERIGFFTTNFGQLPSNTTESKEKPSSPAKQTKASNELKNAQVKLAQVCQALSSHAVEMLQGGSDQQPTTKQAPMKIVLLPMLSKVNAELLNQLDAEGNFISAWQKLTERPSKKRWTLALQSLAGSMSAKIAEQKNKLARFASQFGGAVKSSPGPLQARDINSNKDSKLNAWQNFLNKEIEPLVESLHNLLKNNEVLDTNQFEELQTNLQNLAVTSSIMFLQYPLVITKNKSFAQLLEKIKIIIDKCNPQLDVLAQNAEKSSSQQHYWLEGDILEADNNNADHESYSEIALAVGAVAEMWLHNNLSPQWKSWDNLFAAGLQHEDIAHFYASLTPEQRFQLWQTSSEDAQKRLPTWILLEMLHAELAQNQPRPTDTTHLTAICKELIPMIKNNRQLFIQALAKKDIPKECLEFLHKTNELAGTFIGYCSSDINGKILNILLHINFEYHFCQILNVFGAVPHLDYMAYQNKMVELIGKHINSITLCNPQALTKILVATSSACDSYRMHGADHPTARADLCLKLIELCYSRYFRKTQLNPQRDKTLTPDEVKQAALEFKTLIESICQGVSSSQEFNNLKKIATGYTQATPIPLPDLLLKWEILQSIPFFMPSNQQWSFAKVLKNAMDEASNPWNDCHEIYTRNRMLEDLEAEWFNQISDAGQKQQAGQQLQQIASEAGQTPQNMMNALKAINITNDEGLKPAEILAN